MSNQLDQKTGTVTREFFREPTEAGWTHFVNRYGPRIYDWCRQGLLLAPALIDDVAQSVVVNLFCKMQAGCSVWDSSKGSLHAWLRTVVRNACYDALQQHRPTLELREEDSVVPDIFDQIARDEVQRLAQERTQARVSDKEWRVFSLMDVDGLAGGKVVEHTGLGIGAVYNYRSRVRKVFQQVMLELEGPGP